jgi:FixJ family two-component response regulator
MNQNNLNLYIVDDDEAVCRSMGNLLLSRHFAVQTFNSGESFLAHAHLDSCGVVVLDLRMEGPSGTGMSGLEVFGQLRERQSTLTVVFLSGHGDIPTAMQAKDDGAVGWLEKPCSDDALLLKIGQASGLAHQRYADHVRKQSALKAWSRLSPREVEVAPLFADGKTAKEIARILSTRDADHPIDHRTVENHWAKARAKLGLANSNAMQKFLRDNDMPG